MNTHSLSDGHFGRDDRTGTTKKTWELIAAIRTQALLEKYSSSDLMALKLDFRSEFYFTKGLSRQKVYFIKVLSPKKEMEIRVAKSGRVV